MTFGRDHSASLSSYIKYQITVISSAVERGWWALPMHNNLYRVHRPLRRLPVGYMTKADMSKPTVIPIAI